MNRGGLLALSALLIYAWLAPPFITQGDNAEFSALGTLGGAAHPSGYPLYLLWLRMWSWLPVTTPAHAAALATALIGAVQVLVLHAACRAWGARPIAATLAAAVYATGPVILRIHSEAEVFALNGLIAAAVLWLSALNGPVRGSRRVLALGLVAGLGIANHLTCVLLAPVGLLGVVRGARESGRPPALVFALGGCAMAAGISPYLYLLLTPETHLSWGKLDSVSALVRHFLREDYGGPGQFSPVERGGTAGENIVALLQTHGRAWFWFLPAFGAIVLANQLRPSRVSEFSGESRAGWAMLALSWLVAGPLLASRFNLKPAGLHLYVCQRFHVLPLLIAAVPIALGIDRLGDWGLARVPLNLFRSRTMGAVLSVVVMLASTAIALPTVADAQSPATEQGLRNLLRTLPQDAVVIGAPDAFHFGLGYLQGALGERPDVTVITWPQVGLSSYRDRIYRRIGVRIDPPPADSPEKLSAIVARQVLATGRPLFIDPYQANIAKSLPCYPFGLLFRVLPPGTSVPPIHEVFAINKELYGRYEFGYTRPRSDNQLPGQFHVHYARAWEIIAGGLELAGLRDEHAFALEMARTLAPGE